MFYTWKSARIKHTAIVPEQRISHHPVAVWERSIPSEPIIQSDTTGYSGGLVLFSDCWGGNRSEEVQNSGRVWLIGDPCDWHVSSGRGERVDTISRALIQYSFIPNKTRSDFGWDWAMSTTYPVFLQAPCTQGPPVALSSPGLFCGTWSPLCLQAPGHRHCRTHTLMDKLIQTGHYNKCL